MVAAEASGQQVIKSQCSVLMGQNYKPQGHLQDYLCVNDTRSLGNEQRKSRTQATGQECLLPTRELTAGGKMLR